MKDNKFPAVSHELEFVALHGADVHDIIYGKIDVDPHIKKLTQRVSDRADEDANSLLSRLCQTIENAARKSFYVSSWHWPRDDWEGWCDIQLRGRRRPRAPCYVGLHVGYGQEEFRLIGFARMRKGGLDGQKKFENELREHKGFRNVHLADPKARATRYPKWSNQVIWFECDLAPKLSFQKVEDLLAQRSRVFFKHAARSIKQSLG
jgi:hypothetical protein